VSKERLPETGWQNKTASVKRENFKTVQSGNFEVRVPAQYEVVRHDSYAEQKAFFDSNLGKRIQGSLVRATINSLKFID
jgi:hypothetical protein